MDEIELAYEMLSENFACIEEYNEDIPEFDRTLLGSFTDEE